MVEASQAHAARVGGGEEGAWRALLNMLAACLLEMSSSFARLGSLHEGPLKRISEESGDHSDESRDHSTE